eukprot:scaffold103782_cov30-Attheya_sp.AAC.1
MERETQLTFICAKMIAHEVRILGQVHRFEGQFPETLFAVPFRILTRRHTTASKLGTDAILSVGSTPQSKTKRYRHFRI